MWPNIDALSTGNSYKGYEMCGIQMTKLGLCDMTIHSPHFRIQGISGCTSLLGETLLAGDKNTSDHCNAHLTFQIHIEGFVQDCSISIANTLEIIRIHYTLMW